MTKKTDYSTELLGISFFSKSKEQLLKIITQKIENSSKVSYIVTPNPEQIIQARQDKDFFTVLKNADFKIADGIGLIWASKILAKNRQSDLPRITGRELTLDLLRLAEQKKKRVLVLGGRDYNKSNLISASQQDSAWLLDHSSFSFNWLPGYEDATHPTDIEEELVIGQIKKIKPDIVFVAFGAPKQEKWIWTHQELLQDNQVKIAMAVGGSFDQLLGLVPQTPQYLSRLGLEWLFRLVTQPWRWRRQLRLISFIILVIKERFR